MPDEEIYIKCELCKAYHSNNIPKEVCEHVAKVISDSNVKKEEPNV